MTDLKYFWRQKQEPSADLTKQIIQIKTDDIRPNRAQPRAEFDQNAIIRLADSIRRYGILQPLTVRQTDDEDDTYSYELIAGERRLRASKLLGYLTVPCIVMEATEQVSAELAIIENLLREDLNMFEQAYGFKKLIDLHNLTQDEVARRMSMSQSAVANKLRLLKLSYEEQCMILEFGLTERHARAMLRLDSSETRKHTIQKVSEEKMNVQETEQYIEKLLKTPNKASISEEEPAKLIGFEFTDPEDEAMEILRQLRKRLELWRREGKDVSMNIANGSRLLEVVIRFNK
ncbi:MAG: ParB/RepB/Spo0J family partition protein [Clostridia bacterium]|nr:ParB/RepB/Spo0J family partition protein [Clostridia bacterium]